MREPGTLLASGRDSDIFDYGETMVLRRSRRGRSMREEARIMEYARAHGYPVPAVSEVSDDGTDLVMERVDGPVMLAAIGRQPWTVRRQGALLAELHNRLHEIPAPAWAPEAPCGSGDRLIHLDLHPLNVILTSKGPTVIDWTGAARGAAEVDVALTWVLLASGGIPAGRVKAAVLGTGRSLLVNAFLSGFDLEAIKPQLSAVVEWKVTDPNMTADERQAMRSLAGRLG
ncbi:MAG TPA: phosphotransferase [Acidimicrobiales bacterium]|nr:phosphotransferase [Acidimicrobiales bacterium]